MIDVWGVVANGLWVLGLSILLAMLSWTRWIALEQRVRWRAVLGRSRIQLVMDLSLFLFCAGLAATSRTWWNRILWGLLGMAWMARAWFTGRRKAKR